MPSLLADRQECQKVLSKLVAQAWLDEEFRKRFISEPAAVLEENGLTIPSGVQVRVNENASLETPTSTNGFYEIPLPAQPAGLTDQQIHSWADGDDSDSPIPIVSN